MKGIKLKLIIAMVYMITCMTNEKVIALHDISSQPTEYDEYQTVGSRPIYFPSITFRPGPIEDSQIFNTINKNEEGYRVNYDKDTGTIEAVSDEKGRKIERIPLTKVQIKKFINDVKNADVRFTPEQSMKWESFEKRYSK